MHVMSRTHVIELSISTELKSISEFYTDGYQFLHVGGGSEDPDRLLWMTFITSETHDMSDSRYAEDLY